MDPTADDALEALYATVAAEQAALPSPPVCRMSGVCCDFRTEEHVLFAAQWEVDRAVEFAQAHSESLVQNDPVLCPFWQDHRCHAHTIRPLGCRLYFCDAAYNVPAGPGERISGEAHRALQKLHEQFGIPYAYVPFVQALRERLAVGG